MAQLWQVRKYRAPEGNQRKGTETLFAVLADTAEEAKAKVAASIQNHDGICITVKPLDVDFIQYKFGLA